MNDNMEDQELNETNPAEDKQEKTKEKDWKAEYDELYDKYIRLYSDFDNFRRRTNKEKIDIIDFANEHLMVDLLQVMDDFERAIVSMNDNSDVKGIKDGINLIYAKFRKTLEEKGLKEIECMGKEFDPDLQEAIAKIPAPKKKMKGKIIDQVQKGYYLKNKVIRHSKVVVGE
jgi:molecular chaperone GrpE